MKRKCKACGKTGFRSGTIALVFGNGRHSGGIVCPDCSKAGVLLVASRVAPVKIEKVDSPQLDKILRMLTTYRSAVNSKNDDYDMGKIEGFDSAIDLVKNAIAGRTL